MTYFTRGLWFLCTHASTTLGDVHRTVNWPMSPHSERFRADPHASSVGRSTEGILSNFLKIFCCVSVAVLLSLAATNFLKVVISGGRGGGGDSGPPPGAMV